MVKNLVCKNSDQMVLFCQNIRILRERNKLNKKEMANILNIGIASLTKIEQGLMPPRIGVNIIFRISQYFKIEPHKLFMVL